MKKIVIVTPALGMGGTERVVSVLANEINKSDLNISISVISLIGMESFYDFDKDVNLILSDFDINKVSLGKAKALLQLYKNLKKTKPDVVVSFGEAFNPLVIIVCKILGLSVFVADRSSPERKQNMRTKVLRKLFYPLARGVFVQTQLARTAVLAKNYTKNALVLPNPLIDFDKPKRVVKEKVVVTLGRLIDSKNLMELISIFNAVNKTGEWSLHIIGDGPNKKKIEDFISENNCHETVKLVGAVYDVQTVLSSSSVFAFTSLSEGFPNALSEAIAIPLPVIAYDCIAGPSDLIEDGKNGFLIPLNDKKQYIKKLALLMEDESLRNKFTSNFMAHREKYSTKKITQEFLRAIQINGL